MFIGAHVSWFCQHTTALKGIQYWYFIWPRLKACHHLVRIQRLTWETDIAFPKFVNIQRLTGGSNIDRFSDQRLSYFHQHIKALKRVHYRQLYNSEKGKFVWTFRPLQQALLTKCIVWLSNGSSLNYLLSLSLWAVTEAVEKLLCVTKVIHACYILSQFNLKLIDLNLEYCSLVSSVRSSCSDDGLLYIRSSGRGNFFRFSLSPLIQLMLQVSL